MKSLKKNYIYNLIYQIFMIITPFITTPYVSRVLGAEGIGEYSYALSIVTYFGLFGLLGITTYAQVEIAKNRDDEKECNKLIAELFTLKNITMFITLLLYILLIFFVPEYKKMFVILILYLLSQFNDVAWILQGFEEFKKTVLRSIVIKLFTIICIFLFVKTSDDLYIYSIIMQGVTFIGNFTLWQYVWKYINIKNIISNVKVKSFFKHLKKSFVYFIPTIATSVYTVLDKSMIGWLTNSAWQNGYYEQAHKIEQILVTILTSLGTVTLPRLSYLNKNKSSGQMNSIIEKTITFILMISIPMCVGLIGISDKLIPLFLGDGYEECIILTKVFSLLLIVVGLDSTIGRQCLMATNNQKKFNIGVITGAIVNFLLNIVLIKKYGALGAAISSVIAELVILCIFIVYSKKLLKFNFNSIIKYIISASLMYIVIYYISLLNISDFICLVLQLSCGGIIYFIVLLLLKESFFYNIICPIYKKIINQ